MNQREKEAAQAAVGVLGQVVPYIERGELCPPSVLEDVRLLWQDADIGTMYSGNIRACDVAIKRLGTTRSEALPTTGKKLGRTLRRMRERDIIEFGQTSYDDAAEMAKRVTNAMVANGSYNPLDHCEDYAAATRAANVLLLAAIVDLATAYRMPASEATKRLALEVSTVRTRP